MHARGGVIGGGGRVCATPTIWRTELPKSLLITQGSANFIFFNSNTPQCIVVSFITLQTQRNNTCDKLTAHEKVDGSFTYPAYLFHIVHEQCKKISAVHQTIANKFPHTAQGLQARKC